MSELIEEVVVNEVNCSLGRRSLVKAAAAAVACAVPGVGRSQEPFIMAVNEGVTYRANPLDTQQRWAVVADDLSKLLKVPVKVQSISRYDELREGLAARRYALAYVHPAHHAIRAMTQSGYKLAALTKGFTDYRASFFMGASAGFKSLNELRGRRLGAPDEDSITSVMMRATLRDAGVEKDVNVTYVRYQDAVPFMVEHGLAHVGVSASKSVVNEWVGRGGKVLATSKPVPIKHMLVGPALASRADRISDYFVGLAQEKDGASRLEAMKVSGFLQFDEEPLRAVGQWLAVA